MGCPVSFTVSVIPWVQQQTIDRYGHWIFHPFWLYHTPCIEILFAIIPWVAPVSFTVSVIPWVQQQTIDRYGRITGFCFAAPVPRMSNEHAHTWVLLRMLDEIAFHHKPLLPVVR